MTDGAGGNVGKRDDHYWALDIDRNRWPWRAHLIVGEDGEGRFGYWLTACGLRLSKMVTGCWGTNGDALPMQEHAVHCRARSDRS